MIDRITLSGDGGWVGKGWPRAPLAPPSRPHLSPTSATLPTTLPTLEGRPLVGQLSYSYITVTCYAAKSGP